MFIDFDGLVSISFVVLLWFVTKKTHNVPINPTLFLKVDVPTEILKIFKNICTKRFSPLCANHIIRSLFARADRKYTRCKQDYIYNYNRVIVNTEQWSNKDRLIAQSW